MAKHRGFGAWVGLGVESTWGTPVARTNFLRVQSAGLRRTRTKTRVPHLGHFGQVSTMDRDFYVESDFAGGPIAWPVAYNDSSALLFRHIFGTNVDSGAGPFTHTMTLSSPPPTGLTIEQMSGTAGGSGNMSEVFEGCLINSARLSVEAGQLLMAELDVIAETSQGLVAGGAPTLNTTREYVQHQHLGSSITLGGTAFPCKSFTINVNRNLERNHELGSLFTQVPIEGGLDIEIEATVLWEVDTWDTRYLADTQGSFVATFTGTAPHVLAFTAHNCLITDNGRSVSSKGAVQQSLKLRPFADGTNQGLTAVFTNSNATHLIN